MTEDRTHPAEPEDGSVRTQELPVPGQVRAGSRPMAAEVPESGAYPGALGALHPWSPVSQPSPAGPRTAPRTTRNPAVGLPLLVMIGLVAAFFGWVSAQPFWLSLGAGQTGTVTISSCQSGRCTGTFTSGAFTVRAVRVSGVPGGSRGRGDTVPARMLTASSDWAYVGSRGDLGVRWKIGFGIALLCGLGAGIGTGIRTLRSAGARNQLILWALAMGGPLLLFAGTLLAALI